MSTTNRDLRRRWDNHSDDEDLPPPSVPPPVLPVPTPTKNYYHHRRDTTKVLPPPTEEPPPTEMPATAVPLVPAPAATTTTTTTTTTDLEPPPSTLSISGVDRQLHDSATEQLERFQSSRSNSTSPTRRKGHGNGGSDGTARGIPAEIDNDTKNNGLVKEKAGKAGKAGTAGTAGKTGKQQETRNGANVVAVASSNVRRRPRKPPSVSQSYSANSAIVREFFNHYSRSFDSTVHLSSTSNNNNGSSHNNYIEPASSPSSSAQRRVSRISFVDFARDVGLLLEEEAGPPHHHRNEGPPPQLPRHSVDDVFVRTLEQQQRELNAYETSTSRNVSFSSAGGGGGHRQRGLDYQSFKEATMELFVLLSHHHRHGHDGHDGNDGNGNGGGSTMGEDVARRLNTTLRLYQSRLMAEDAVGHTTTYATTTTTTTTTNTTNNTTTTSRGAVALPPSPSMVHIAKIKRKLRASAYTRGGMDAARLFARLDRRKKGVLSYLDFSTFVRQSVSIAL